METANRGDLDDHLTFVEEASRARLRKTVGKNAGNVQTISRCSVILSSQSSTSRNLPISSRRPLHFKKLSTTDLIPGSVLKITEDDVLGIGIQNRVVGRNEIIDAEGIRRRSAEDFHIQWEAGNVLGRYAAQLKTFQLMSETPIKFDVNNIEREDFNLKYKHFEWYEEIRRKAEP